MSESEEPRPDRQRNRIIFWAALGAAAILGVIVVISRDAGRGLGTSDSYLKNDPHETDRSTLPDSPDSGECGEFLRGLDLGISRPTTSREQLQPLVDFLKLDAKEAETLAQPSFTLVDAEYLADCCLIRDAVKSLALKNDPPLRQAERCFAWICRQTYLSNKHRFPAPPWWVLQAGAANGIDRANIFFAMMNQLGLDCCVAGPGQLGSLSTVLMKNGRIEYYAPIRAVGARIGKEIFLFDPWLGEPIAIGDKTATLAQLEADPARAAEWLKSSRLDAKELGQWQVFLAAPLPALSPRMQWLEKRLPASNGVKLYVDLPAAADRFKQEAGVACKALNPPGDPSGLVLVFDTFYRENKRPDGLVDQPMKEMYRESQFPAEFIPVLRVDGQPLTGNPWKWVQTSFRQQFGSSFLKAKSGRDSLLRGDFNNAILAFSNQRFQGGGAAATQRDVDLWAKKANSAFAALVDPNPARRETASSALDEFLKSPLTERIEGLIRHETSTLLSAEAAYQIALAKHEQAERIHARWLRQPDDKRRAEAESKWNNAALAWSQYPQDAELRRSFSDRNRHADRLWDECKRQINVLHEMKGAAGK